MNSSMDVAALATGLAQSKLATDVGYAVQRKTMDSAKAQGEALISMIDSAAQIGKSDALSAAATGKGGQIDVYG